MNKEQLIKAIESLPDDIHAYIDMEERVVSVGYTDNPHELVEEIKTNLVLNIEYKNGGWNGVYRR